MAPVDFMHKLINYYRKEKKEDVPIISTRAAAGLSVLCTLIYVLPFYLSSKTRPSPQLSRDAPTVIKARIRAVTFSCIVTTLLAAYLALGVGHLSYADTLEVLGWWPVNAMDFVKTLGLAVILFLGPLFEAAVVEGQWRDWLIGRYLTETLASSVGWRNYIAGPITEEIVFRSVIITLHLFAHISPSKLVFVTPLYFGIAHVHHFYEYTLTHPHTPFTPALARSLFQFAYTSIFGFYAAFVFLRTGSLPAVIAAHSFCNWMGLPRFWGRIETPVPIGPPVATKKADLESPLYSVSSEELQVAGGRLSIAWTVAYYLLLVAGAVAFYQNLWTMTESQNALVTFDKA